MSSSRPAVPYRWEFKLAEAMVAVLVAVGQARRHAVQKPDDDVVPPEVRQWRNRQRPEDATHPWVQQVARERSALRAATDLWLAWRSYHLERQSNGRG